MKRLIPMLAVLVGTCFAQAQVPVVRVGIVATSHDLIDVQKRDEMVRDLNSRKPREGVRVEAVPMTTAVPNDAIVTPQLLLPEAHKKHCSYIVLASVTGDGFNSDGHRATAPILEERPPNWYGRNGDFILNATWPNDWYGTGSGGFIAANYKLFKVSDDNLVIVDSEDRSFDSIPALNTSLFKNLNNAIHGVGTTIEGTYLEGTYKYGGFSIRIPNGLTGVKTLGTDGITRLQIHLPSGGSIAFYGAPNSQGWKSAKEGVQDELTHANCGPEQPVSTSTLLDHHRVAEGTSVCNGRFLRVHLTLWSSFWSSRFRTSWLILETTPQNKEDLKVFDNVAASLKGFGGLRSD